MKRIKVPLPPSDEKKKVGSMARNHKGGMRGWERSMHVCYVWDEEEGRRGGEKLEEADVI
jgi:hypothetical protein